MPDAQSLLDVYRNEHAEKIYFVRHELDFHKVQLRPLPPTAVCGGAEGEADLGNIFGLTNRGKVRGNNEDGFLIFKDGNREIIILADGLGGVVGGELASRLAIQTIYTLIMDGKPVADAINIANEVLILEQNWNPQYKKMGTVIDVATIEGKKLQLWHVGDGRIYCIKGSKRPAEKRDVLILSRDQIFLWRLLEEMEIELPWPLPAEYEGVLTLAAMELSRRRFCGESFDPCRLTSALGVRGSPKIFNREYQLKKGDRLLFCSDGLYGILGGSLPAYLKQLAGEGADLAVSARTLLEEALMEGGYDNITLVLREAG